MGKMVNRL